MSTIVRVWRLVGYISPLLIFIFVAVWFRPQGSIGWTAVMFVTMMSLMLPIMTLASVRREVNRRTVPPGMLHFAGECTPTSAHFVEPRLGEVSMVSFVRRRP